MMPIILCLFHLLSLETICAPSTRSAPSFLTPSQAQEIFMVKLITHSIDREPLQFFFMHHARRQSQQSEPSQEQAQSSSFLPNTHAINGDAVLLKDYDAFLETYLIIRALIFLHNHERAHKFPDDISNENSSLEETNPHLAGRALCTPLHETEDYRLLIQRLPETLTATRRNANQTNILSKLIEPHQDTQTSMLRQTSDTGFFALTQLIRSAERGSYTARLLLIELYCEITPQYKPSYLPGAPMSPIQSDDILQELKNQLKLPLQAQAHLTLITFSATPGHKHANIHQAEFEISFFITEKTTKEVESPESFGFKKISLSLTTDLPHAQARPTTKIFSEEEASRIIPVILKCVFHIVPIPLFLLKKALYLFEEYQNDLSWKPGIFSLSSVYSQGIATEVFYEQAVDILRIAQIVYPHAYTPQMLECYFNIKDNLAVLAQEDMPSLEATAQSILVEAIELQESRLMALFYLLHVCQKYEQNPEFQEHWADFQIQPNNHNATAPNSPHQTFLEKCMQLAARELTQDSFPSNYENKKQWIRLFLSHCYCNGMLGYRSPRHAFNLLSAIDDKNKKFKPFIDWLCAHKNHNQALQSKYQPPYCYCAYLGNPEEKPQKMLLGHTPTRMKDKLKDTFQRSSCKNCQKPKSQKIAIPDTPQTWEDNLLFGMLDCALNSK
jgi:hypothetical protein